MFVAYRIGKFSWQQQSKSQRCCGKPCRAATILLSVMILTASIIPQVTCKQTVGESRKSKRYHHNHHQSFSSQKHHKYGDDTKDTIWKTAMETATKIKGDFDKLQQNVNDLVADINKGMETALEGLEYVQSVLEHSEDKECLFHCKHGGQPISNPNFKPTINGCGSYGLKFNVTEYPQVEQCCNTHDLCYDTCGASRRYCDNVFRECLVDACAVMSQNGPQQSLCEAAAEMSYAGAHSLGCKAFQESQTRACLCPDKDEL